MTVCLCNSQTARGNIVVCRVLFVIYVEVVTTCVVCRVLFVIYVEVVTTCVVCRVLFVIYVEVVTTCDSVLVQLTDSLRQYSCLSCVVCHLC